MANLDFNLVLLVMISIFHGAHSWSWFSNTGQSANHDAWMMMEQYDGNVFTEFSMETLNDPKGIKLVTNAQRRMTAPNSCWQEAYRNLFAGCSEIIVDKEKQSRLAWHLSDCFQKESGRPAFPPCSSQTLMKNCLKNLDEFAHKTYLEFFLETNSICHQLQADAFKRETERLVNDLTRTARFAEEKLESIEERSESLLQSSTQIQDSLTSVDLRTQQVAQASKNVHDQVIEVLKHSRAIFEQSKDIAASQSELQDGQAEMRATMESGIALVQESYKHLGDGIEKLSKESVEIEREIQQVGESMSSKIQDVQRKAGDIGHVAVLTLEKQKQLLDGQSTALEGLDFLTTFLSQALEESRGQLKKLADFGHKQQEELLRRQQELERAHDHLIQNSQSILAAQEEFGSKQATIFAALDKLFTLHNAILLESRFVKTFFFYASVIFTTYILTSAKQTSGVRARIYLGICVTFMTEFTLVRLGANDLERQTRIASNIFWARSSFLLAASIQIMHSIFTYRDYEIINHRILLNLMEKFDSIEQNKGKNLLPTGTQSESVFSSWIDAELPEDVDPNDDPDYRLPPDEVGEISITTASFTRYNLRPRFRH